MTALLILLVEDREVDANEAVWTLEDIGVDNASDLVRRVETSAEALAFVKAEHPQTVLMDVNLTTSPVDGYELTEQIKALNGFDVVMLTTDTRPEEVERAKRAGAKAFLEKLEGEAFANVMTAFKFVFMDGNYCPPGWLDRFVWIDPSLVDGG